MMGIGGPLNATILYSFNCCLETDNLSNGGIRLNEKPKSTQLSARPLILLPVYLNTSLICLHQLTQCKDRKFFLGVPPNSSVAFSTTAL